MLNRELAAIFKSENNIPEFAVLVTEVDNAGQFTDHRSNVRDIARNAARVIRSCLPADVLLCRFDGFRFGMIYKNTERQCIADLAGRIQQSMAYYASGVKAAQNQLSIAISIGVCMYSKAADAFDIVSLAERALREAQASGMSTINFYEGAVAGGQSKNFSLYNYRA